ncbi:MAG: type II secretion system protein GspD, partial [Sulfurovum sp.]|nr:type II secretion system protein GspD [Sulfurovum sp.]
MKLNKLLLIFMTTITMMHAAPSDETVNVNFRNLDIKDFVEMVSKITNKNILIDAPLKGKINFVSTQPIKKNSLIPLANAILSNKGFTLVDQGDFMQVVKSSEAAGMGLAVDDKISGNTLKTVLFKLKTSNAAVIRAKIKPLLHKNAKVVSFKNNNVLSITANPRTLKSIKKIIDSVEGAGQKGSTVIKLRNASAKAVHANAVKMAGQLFPKTIPSEKVDVLKDDATNSIILVGKKENVNRMIRYVKQLDQKGNDVEQKMYVIELKNSNVEDLEKILGKLVSQMNNMSVSPTKKGGKPPKKAMVVGDVERNALIVLATGEQIKNIRKVIRS